MKHFLHNLFLSLVAVLAPIKAVILTVGCLILADFLTGVFKAWRKKDPITSNKMKRTVAKMVMYQTAVITGFLLETYILDGIPVTKLVAGIIGIVEFKSVLENIEAVTGINFSGLITKLQNPHTPLPKEEEEKKDP